MMQPASRVFGTPDIRYFDFTAVQGFCNVNIMAFHLQVCMKSTKYAVDLNQASENYIINKRHRTNDSERIILQK